MSFYGTLQFLSRSVVLTHVNVVRIHLGPERLLHSSLIIPQDIYYPFIRQERTELMLDGVGAASWYRYWTRPCCLQSEEDFYDRPTLNAQRERAMIQTH